MVNKLTREELSTFLPNQRTIRNFETLQVQTNESSERLDIAEGEIDVIQGQIVVIEGDIDDLEYKVFGPRARPDIAPFRSVYVDVNGDDSNDGSLLNPLATIEAAVILANLISPFNVFVVVGAGTYVVDNPVVLPNNTQIVPWDDSIWVVAPQDTTKDVFQVSATNADVALYGGAIIGLGTTGAGINQSGVGTTVGIRDMRMRDIAGVAFKVSNGAMVCDGTELSELDSIGTGYEVTNGATLTISTNGSIDDATVTTAYKADGSGTILNLIGPTLIDSTNITTLIEVDNGAMVKLGPGFADGPTTAIKLNNGSTIDCVGFTLANTTTDINVLDTASSVRFVGAELDKNKIIFPGGYTGENMLFQDNTQDEEATKVYGDLFVGRPEHGTALNTGEGEPTTRGMVVLTTDSTATSTTDGGNFVDESDAAQTINGDSFTFQGVTANHTILIASTLHDGTDVIQHPGVFIKQEDATVEVTPKSFIFEYWDGTNWSEITVMSMEDMESYRYGNDVFIRTDTREHIRYNADISSLWTKKTINGTNAFWSRIRIATTVTTAPVFDQFRLHANFGEFASDGYGRFYGRARFRQTLLAAGNVYSETGGITNFDLAIGSGGLPTGWTHRGNNQQFTGAGDAIYMQFVLPRGIDTASGMRISMTYIPEQSGASTDASFIISALPIETQGVLEADPAGGTTPVARTLTNTVAITANAAQATTVSTPIVDNTKLQKIESDPIDISDFYEGDMLFIRVEMDSDGSASKDVFAMAVEINAVIVAHGERLS